MSSRRPYPRTFVLVMLVVLFSISMAGKNDNRFVMTAQEWTYTEAEQELLDGVGPLFWLAELGNDARVDTVTGQHSYGEMELYDASLDRFAAASDFQPESIHPGAREEEQQHSETSITAEDGPDTLLRTASAGDEEKPMVDEPQPEAEEEDDTKPAEPEERPTVVTHTVSSGETLWDIAIAYNTTVDSIVAANDITNVNRIREGQELRVLTVAGVLHTVSPGESLWEIAERYRIAIDKIAQANDIQNPARIQPSMELLIPGATRTIHRDVLVHNGQLQRAFAWPLTGRISSPFGPRWGRMHNGIDIAVPEGTPIRAAAGGRVTYTGYNGGYGNLVIIDHGSGVETRYAHNSRNIVSVGERVDRGQVIAYSGNTGVSTGPHLHFEIRLNGTPVDPKKYLR